MTILKSLDEIEVYAWAFRGMVPKVVRKVVQVCTTFLGHCMFGINWSFHSLVSELKAFIVLVCPKLLWTKDHLWRLVKSNGLKTKQLCSVQQFYQKFL